MISASKRVSTIVAAAILLLSIPACAVAAIELISKMKTPAGELRLVINDDNYEHVVTLNGKVIFREHQPDRMSVQKVFKFQKSDLVLLYGHAGNSERWYYFLTIYHNGGHSISGAMVIPQAGEKIEIKGDKVIFQYSNNEHWEYQNGELTKTIVKSDYVGDDNCRGLYSTYAEIECNAYYDSFNSFCMATQRFLDGIWGQFNVVRFEELCVMKSQYQLTEQKLKERKESQHNLRIYAEQIKRMPRTVNYATFKNEVCMIDDLYRLVDDLLQKHKHDFYNLGNQLSLRKINEFEYEFIISRGESGDAFKLIKKNGKWDAIPAVYRYH